MKHISAYMLKIEEGTPYEKMSLPLPDEDEVCDLYLYASDYLEAKGFEHFIAIPDDEYYNVIKERALQVSRVMKQIREICGIEFR